MMSKTVVAFVTGLMLVAFPAYDTPAAAESDPTPAALPPPDEPAAAPAPAKKEPLPAGNGATARTRAVEPLDGIRPSSLPARDTLAGVVKKSPVSYHLGARQDYQLWATPNNVDCSDNYESGLGCPTGTASEQYLHLGVDGNFSYRDGRFNGLVSGDLWWNLHETPPFGTPGNYELATIHDGSSPLWYAVYELYGGYEGTGVLRRARVGRQVAEHGRPMTFDGAYGLIQPVPRLNIFAFGGRTEHFFEAVQNQPIFEDWVGSAGASYRVLPNLRFELDYRLMRETVLQNNGPSGDQNPSPVLANTLGLKAEWHHGQMLWVKAYARGVSSPQSSVTTFSGQQTVGGNKLSEVALIAKYFHEKSNAGVDLFLHAQPAVLDELDELDNPFFATLGTSLPHAKWRLEAFKSFAAKTFACDAYLGYEGWHLLRAQDHETAFNHNLMKVYLMASLDKLRAIKGLSFTASIDRTWASNGALWSLDGAVAYELKTLRAEIGTQYYRYSYQYLFDTAQNVQEIAGTRVVYAEASYKITGWLSVRGRYSLEIADRTFHSLSIGLAQSN